MNYTHVFWDWNGTLLDDVDYCIATVNRSLSARNMPLLDKDRYYRLFRFPIRDYYTDLGFSFREESYELLAEEYNRHYAENNGDLPLRKNAEEVLAVFKGKGIRQYILSASERTVLESALSAYGIDGYFEKVLSTDNYLAEGKISYGKKFAETLPPDASVLLVGDTEHDVETARAIGADCVLLRGGHSADDKLSSFGVKIIGDLHELYPIVLGTPVCARPKVKLFDADSLERRSFDIAEAEPASFRTRYKDFYDDLKNTNKTEDW